VFLPGEEAFRVAGHVAGAQEVAPGESASNLDEMTARVLYLPCLDGRERGKRRTERAPLAEPADAPRRRLLGAGESHAEVAGEPVHDRLPLRAQAFPPGRAFRLRLLHEAESLLGASFGRERHASAVSR
jgi:hypothetical protein